MEISFEQGAVTSSATAEDSQNLTFDKLLETMAELERTKLYYAVTEFIPAGDFFLVPAGDYHPDYVVIHPDGFARIKDELALYRTLIPLADYRPTVTEMRPMRNEYRSRWFR